jgi:hypothetical protein
MRPVSSTLTSANVLKSGWGRTDRKDRLPKLRFDNRANACAIFAAAAALSLISDCASGQTTSTNPSAASTIPTISSSSTSPNSPCYSSTNPTSPCYSANAPGNPCYDATNPNKPCSTTTVPYARTSPLPLATTTPEATARALTADQAKAQIEAKGYSSVSGLRKDVKGNWHSKAEKDGIPVAVTLDVNGNVTSN